MTDDRYSIPLIVLIACGAVIAFVLAFTIPAYLGHKADANVQVARVAACAKLPSRQEVIRCVNFPNFQALVNHLADSCNASQYDNGKYSERQCLQTALNSKALINWAG